MSNLLLPRGNQKPINSIPLVNYAHPFSRGLIVGMAFNHPYQGWKGVTRGLGAGAGETLQPFWGSLAPRTISSNIYDGIPQTGGTLVSIGFSTSLQTGPGVLTHPEDIINFGPDFLPTSAVTVCFITRNWGSSGAGGMFGVNGNPTGTTCADIYIPLINDASVYLDWGGQSGAGRLVSPAQTFSAYSSDSWVFVAGNLGMSIWRNGIRIANTTTPNPGRVQNPALNVLLGDLSFGGERRQVFFFQLIDYQWSDTMCRDWSAQPYAHLYQPWWTNLVGIGVGGTIGATETYSSVFT